MKGRVVLVLLALLLVAAPPASALKVHAPTHVFGFDIAIAVDDIQHGANATLTFDGKVQSTQQAQAGSRPVWTFTDLHVGKHTWSVRVVQNPGGTAPQYINGTVLIEDPAGVVGQLAALREAVDRASMNSSRAVATVDHFTGNETGLRALMDDFEARIGQLDTMLAGLEGVKENQTQAQVVLTSLSKSTSKDLAEVQELQSQTTVAAQAASTWGIVAVTIGTMGSLLMLAAAAILYINGRARHREAMALLLAFAAKSGVTPDSEELKVAFEALGDD